MRRIVDFACEEHRLVGTVDEASGTTGILIVSGGNEVRVGAHRGMVSLAQRLASAGVPTFRFDRRGIGDSEGENGGYSTSAPDITAALAAFRREQPHVERVIGFGNCDAATALLLFDRGCDAVVLANPWLGDEGAPPPPAALRAYYLRRIGDPAAWWRAARKGLGPLLANMIEVVRSPRDPPLASRVAASLGTRPATIVLARGDRTGQVFAAGIRVPSSVRTVTLDTASHSFAGAGEALAQAVLAAVAALDDKRDT